MMHIRVPGEPGNEATTCVERMGELVVIQWS